MIIRKRIATLIRSSPVFSLLLLLCFLLWSSTCFVSYRRVVGDSMAPTFTSGSILVCTRSADPESLRYGDCVVAEIPSSGETLTVTKRIAGLPGDRIQIRNGILYRNGTAVSEDFPIMKDAGAAEDTILLAPGEYFLLGDNRNHSRDSREFGPVAADCITNQILFHIF